MGGPLSKLCMFTDSFEDPRAVGVSLGKGIDGSGLGTD